MLQKMRWKLMMLRRGRQGGGRWWCWEGGGWWWCWRWWCWGRWWKGWWCCCCGRWGGGWWCWGWWDQGEGRWWCWQWCWGGGRWWCFRMMMLRTRTDPKTGNHLHVKCRRPRPGTTLCAILRSRHAHHKSRFIRKFTGKKPQPRTAAHTLCEPAQSKCTSTCHKGHFIQKFPGKMPAPEPRRRLCASLHSRHAHQHVTRAFLYNFFLWKMPRPRTAARTLCEPAQSKRTSTRHKSSFILKITRKMPRPSWSTLIKHRPSHLP